MEWVEEESTWDAVKGGYLDPEEVRKARAEELDWARKSDMYDVVPRTEAFEVTGKRPVDLKWVDTNKGDPQNPVYRSRLVRERQGASGSPRRICFRACHF